MQSDQLEQAIFFKIHKANVKKINLVKSKGNAISEQYQQLLAHPTEDLYSIEGMKIQGDTHFDYAVHLALLRIYYYNIVTIQVIFLLPQGKGSRQGG